MDTLSEIQKLIEARDESENRVGRRVKHIPILYTGLGLSLVGWLVTIVLWYAKMEQTRAAVKILWFKITGYDLPWP